MARGTHSTTVNGTINLLNKAIVTKRALKDIQKGIRDKKKRRVRRSRRTLRASEGVIVDAKALAKRVEVKLVAVTAKTTAT